MAQTQFPTTYTGTIITGHNILILTITLSILLITINRLLLPIIACKMILLTITLLEKAQNEILSKTKVNFMTYVEYYEHDDQGNQNINMAKFHCLYFAMPDL